AVTYIGPRFANVSSLVTIFGIPDLSETCRANQECSDLSWCRNGKEIVLLSEKGAIVVSATTGAMQREISLSGNVPAGTTWFHCACNPCRDIVAFTTGFRFGAPD